MARANVVAKVLERTQSDPLPVPAHSVTHKAICRDRCCTASHQIVSAAITIRVYALGQFRVHLSDHLSARQALWPNRQTRQLLWYLLTSPTYACAREQLIEKFWPNATLMQGRAYLRQALSRLRRTLDPLQRPYGNSSFLQSDWETVRLVVIPTEIPAELNAHPVDYRSCQPSGKTGIWLDTAQFQDLVAAALPVLDGAFDSDGQVALSNGRVIAARAAAESAVALYHGDFLPVERYDDDIERTRLHYHRMWRTLVRYLIYFALAERHYNRASLLLSTLLHMDPGDEDAAASLIHVQWAEGYREDALKTYQRVVGYLDDTLAIGPSPRLKSLYHALRSGVEAPPFKGSR